ncbi:short transmembrane mitochondrial protein 1 [Topomyia yanbarensis]|uniref:short transmembrane mitochondrial protein 1 n=1 Tax=Topomyia yanbarensis TaxID=2498891 RepID=UPI00273B6799|nr:short transmembrane mitochondrial protein 1 [Topomyia yanbarensis]
MLKFLLTFGAGVYTGIYVTQNFDVPRVDEPAKLWEKTSEKVKEFLDDHKKP